MRARALARRSRPRRPPGPPPSRQGENGYRPAPERGRRREVPGSSRGLARSPPHREGGKHSRAVSRSGTQLEAAAGERNALLHADQPEAATARGAPARRLEIEAATIVAHREGEPSAGCEEPHPEIMSTGMPQHIIDRFLRDPKARRFGIRLELRRRLARIEMRRDAGDARLPVEVRTQRRRKSEIVA